jgi:prolyl-tRNA synthetase
MRQSKLFTKTRKEAPADEVSKNAKLLIRAGFINKEMAGVYSYLPLGLRVLNNIINIIREEMNKVDGQEVFMTTLQEKDNWQKTGRWDDNVVDVWFKTELKSGGELGLANTHEEAVSSIMTNHIKSYKDLPKYVYQFQTKFRNETRAKSGIMRTREFIMKDLYSFDVDQESLDSYYEKVSDAYKNIFERVGLGEITYKTFASGGSFSKFSHEFQTICPAGEDIIYIDKNKKIAINKEVLTDEVLNDLSVKKEDLVEEKAIEVGNIFKLGSKYSEPLGLVFTDEKGESKPVVMGCYGIGPGRVMGTIVETFADESGIVWPESVAPFRVHLVSVGNSSEVSLACEVLYKKLNDLGIETLYDDRDLRPGEKFADSDLLGIPTRVVISEKTLEKSVLEVKNRKSGESKFESESDFLKNFI